ncbi:hypothetical protein H5410_059676 [Solanum commersonii]|uniref:F-box domain-containing protein n=1 Tax=Solanum commersonii TaxID=4109 RepID=A0A9J5W471_SOLCO|nr:hypothetical protein H5410_059676 [Solanum commersonii]
MDTQIKNQNYESEEVASSKYGFDFLFQEFVLDIASRLPITSLLQFTFVRKSFHNLSHDPELLQGTVPETPLLVEHISVDETCNSTTMTSISILQPTGTVPETPLLQDSLLFTHLL